MRDIKAWKEAVELGGQIILLASRMVDTRPLTTELERTAMDVPSYIAMGYVRKDPSERLGFYTTAKSQLARLETLLAVAYVAKQLLSEPEYQHYVENVTVVGKELSKLL